MRKRWDKMCISEVRLEDLILETGGSGQGLGEDAEATAPGREEMRK